MLIKRNLIVLKIMLYDRRMTIKVKSYLSAGIITEKLQLKKLLSPQRPQEKQPTPAQPAMFHDVASILQRRKFLMGDMCEGGSNSETESEGEWDDEDDSWN